MNNLKSLIVTLLLFLASHSSNAAFILEGGQEIYNFNPSDFSQSITTSSDGATFSFSFANSFDIGGLEDPHLFNGHLELGEAILIDFYENHGDSNPFETQIINGEDPEINNFIFTWIDFLNTGNTFIPWMDLEGSIVFTSLVGEIELNTSTVALSDNGVQDSAELSVTAVPLPPSLPLFLTSLLTLFFCSHRSGKT